tara:strand:- start:6084 stop:6296 length:213 start_codon:yes stop_codon:yes gene_type:complete
MGKKRVIHLVKQRLSEERNDAIKSLEEELRVKDIVIDNLKRTLSKEREEQSSVVKNISKTKKVNKNIQSE